jgi:hypothetical protein
MSNIGKKSGEKSKKHHWQANAKMKLLLQYIGFAVGLVKIFKQKEGWFCIFRQNGFPTQTDSQNLSRY